MQFEYTHTQLFAILNNPRSTDPIKICVSNLLRLPSTFLKDLLTATENFSTGFRFRTKQSLVYQALRGFADFLEVHELEIPLTNLWDWQILVSEFVWWFLSRGSSKAKLKSRVSIWQKIVRPWLEFLILEGVIPTGLIICNLKLPSENSSAGTALKATVLGESVADSVIKNEQIIKQSYVDKTLAGPIFWHSSEEYLDEIENSLRTRNTALKVILNDHWLKLVKDYRRGMMLMKKIPEDIFISRKYSGNWKIANSVPQRRNLYLTSPNVPLASSWILRLMKDEIENGDKTNCVSRASLSVHDAFAYDYCSISGTGIVEIKNSTSLNEHQQKYYSSSQLFERFLGILNSLDMSVALAILIQEHPNFTPEAIAGAELADKYGKTYLLRTDAGDERIFSVEKHRAKSRKFAVLSKRSKHILKHLIRVTQPIREILIRANISQSRYLFMGMIKNGGAYEFGHPTHINAHRLHNSNGLSLAGLYPQLQSFGLTSGTLTFEKIRCTQGVIGWFEKGSIETCAKILGNLPQTSLDHYLPKPLIEMWNERLIRRFQNTIIVLAVDDNSNLLDFVDMPNISDLNSFLSQLVHEIPAGKSPISDLIAKKFGDRFNAKTKNIEGRLYDQLTIKISVDSIAYLLAYKEWCYTSLNTDQRVQIDERTGLSPSHFIQIAELMQAVANSDVISDAVREAFDVVKLKRIYAVALDLVPNLVRKLTNVSIVVGTL